MSFDLATHRRPYVTATELAEYLRVDRRTVIRMITITKSLRGTKVGRCWRIPTEAALTAFHVEQIQTSKAS